MEELLAVFGEAPEPAVEVGNAASNAPGLGQLSELFTAACGARIVVHSPKRVQAGDSIDGCLRMAMVK